LDRDRDFRFFVPHATRTCGRNPRKGAQGRHRAREKLVPSGVSHRSPPAPGPASPPGLQGSLWRQVGPYSLHLLKSGGDARISYHAARIMGKKKTLAEELAELANPTPVAGNSPVTCTWTTLWHLLLLSNRYIAPYMPLAPATLVSSFGGGDGRPADRRRQRTVRRICGTYTCHGSFLRA